LDENRALVSATIKGTAWNYLVFGLSKGVTFVTTVILARLLSPDEFGLMAIGLLVIGYLDTFGGLGMENVVIYRQDNTEYNANVAFTIGIIFDVIISAVTFLCAPWVAAFFKEPRVTDILRVLSLVFIIWGMGDIHAARLKKEMQFRQTLLPEFGKAAAKAVVSIGMAFAGFGVWSLVWGQVAANIAASTLYWIVYRWRPRLTLDFKTSRQLVSYSSQTVLSEFMGAIQGNIDYLIVGKRLGPDNLGFYTMAFRVPELLIINTCYIVSNALFPAYARLQNDLDALRKGFLLTLRYIAIYTVPVGVGLFLITPEIVDVLFGQKWAPAIPVMQAISLYAVIYSLSFNAGDIYKAIGRPDLMNILGLFKLGVVIPLLWVAGGYNIYYVGLAQVAAHSILTVVRFLVIRSVIKLRWREIFSALQPAVTSTLAMFVCTYAFHLWLKNLPSLLSLILLPLVGGVVYAAALWLTNREVALKGLEILRRTFIKKSKVETSS
jgi:PST family polysaccharide transporter